jgi:hypothetical protein
MKMLNKDLYSSKRRQLMAFQKHCRKTECAKCPYIQSIRSLGLGRVECFANWQYAKAKGEAKWKLGAEYEYAYCSHCGRQQWASWDSYREAIENIGEFHKEYKFCPNCGFEMKGDC